MIRIRSTHGEKCQETSCDKKYYARGLCKMHHQRLWKRGLIPKNNIVTLSEKIKMFSEHDATTDCWIWSRTKNNKGYGRVSISGGRSMYAHRASYIEFNGEIPDGMEVCHKCDRPACVNPGHLFLGTHLDNMRDSASKGRMRNSPKYGTSHHNAFFNDEMLNYIRNSDKRVGVLAKELGCNRNTISRARIGRTYKNNIHANTRESV